MHKSITQLGRYFVDHLLYNQLAWSYDAVSWFVSLGDWQAWGQASIPYVQGRRVLEIGFGRGHLLPVLQQHGRTVTGIDLSPNMLKTAQKHNIPLVRGNVLQLPFTPNAFDTVVSTFPAGFIVQPHTLRGLHRVLAPHGRLIIVPSASFTQQAAVHHIIDGLYALIGQPKTKTGTGVNGAAEPLSSWGDHIDQFGFDTTLHTTQLARSKAHVIVATKR